MEGVSQWINIVYEKENKPGFWWFNLDKVEDLIEWGSEEYMEFKTVKKMFGSKDKLVKIVIKKNG